MEIQGLPAHPLVVHLVVVLIPLTALALILAQLWPAARRRLGLVPLIAAVAVAALVPFTIAAGEALAAVVGPLPDVQAHEARGRAVQPWALALPVVAAGQWAWFRRGRDRIRRDGAARAITLGIGAAVLVVAVGVVVAVVLAGESGARAVWGGLLG
ncbi:hypothetical protein B5M43_004400 [Microbacterium sp. MEC084]|jgi:Ca2+/H+ antiporter|uniref:DUF2231 domain-containing protein n=1 Tax=Microbacterium sp. MEC084 TaxID=1963027 RepID=UPI00106FC6DC|nr:DUF2231 domain-containing protein [Microbacterium sp. MEC084]MCD1268090.1 hypothetical protein [Microbacterium sp. MEC084]